MFLPWPGLPAQEIKGVVRDSLTGTPVADAQVALIGALGELFASTRTSRDGAFALSAKAPGTYSVFARRMGFRAARSDAIAVGSEVVETTVLMTRIPHFLPNVAIQEEKESIMKQRLFGMKVSTLGATVVTPTQVDRALPTARNALDLINHSPGAGLSVDQERKCVLSLRGYPPMCLPVVIDGVLVSADGDIEDAVPADIVDYIIILRGNETGVLFGSVGEKGVVLVYTKRGLKRGPSR